MQDKIGSMGRALLSLAISATLLTVLSVSGWSQGCSTCGVIKGIEVDDKLGTVCVVPVTAGVDIGLGAPYRLDKDNLPSEGNVRYYAPPSPGVPYVKWGRSRFTFSGSNVLIDGVQKPGWTWYSTTYAKMLTAPDGSRYQFEPANPNLGVLTSSSGANGLGVTTYTYTADRISSVTDRYGNQWTYGSDASSFGPTYVINPDGTRKVGFTYKAAGTNGAGQYDVVTVYKLSGSTWVEQEHTDYTYDSSSRVTQISNVNVTDTSTTNVEYAGDYVSRVENYQLKYDVIYEYSTSNITTSGGTYPYGVVTIRRRSTYGQDTDSSDQRTKYFYYLDADNKNRYLFRQVSQVYNGSAWSDYAKTEYRRYGYNNRFTDAPTDSTSLNGKPWKEVDPRGNATTHAYSSTNGQVTITTLPTGDYTQVWFKQINGQDSAFVEKMRDNRGNFTRFTRDSTYPSLLTKVEASDNDSTYISITEMSYYTTPTQKQGLLYQETIPDIEGTDDMVTTYDYEETIDSTVYYRSSPTSVSYAWFNPATSAYETKTSTTSYYRDGRIRYAKDALNNQTDFSYDTTLRLTQTWLPADVADRGSVSSNTSALVTDTTKSWLQDQLMGMALQVTSGTYSGNIYSITGNTSTTLTVSGSLPNLTGVSYAVRPYADAHYLGCCNLADWEQDARGKKTYNTYDSERLILTEVRNDVTGINSTKPLVKYTYNDLGQKTEERTYKDSSDTTGRLTSHKYDQLGRLIKAVYPDDSGTRLLWDEYYQYDVNNNLVAKLVGIVDSNGSITEGSVTAYAYDSLNRLTKVKDSYSASTWPISSISISNQNVSYQYEGGSPLKTQMVDGSGTSGYTYDKQGQLVTYAPSQPSGYSVEYTYNANGDKTSVLVKSGANNKYRTTYSYFKNGWLKQVNGQSYDGNAWADQTGSSFAYDAIGNRKQRKNGVSGEDVRTEYAYDARNYVTSIHHYVDQAIYEAYGMVYKRDGAGNPISVEFVGDACPSVYKDKTVRCSYDAISRLVSETVDNGTPTNWSYDWVGNRGTATDCNAVDEYLADCGRVYDKLGNLKHLPDALANNRTDYTYTADNLLHDVTDVVAGVGTTTTMTWNAEQQRIRVQRGAYDRRFIYDPTASIPAVLFTVENTYGYDAYYVREPDGDLLASCANGWENVNYNYDGLGSVVLVSEQGGIMDASAYDAWGNTIESVNHLAPYRFVGQLGYYSHDADSVGAGLGELMQLGVRFYDAEVGRFTQRDPAKDGLNWYGYVNDGPMLRVDPTGKISNMYKKQCRTICTNWLHMAKWGFGCCNGLAGYCMALHETPFYGTCNLLFAAACVGNQTPFTDIVACTVACEKAF